LTISQGHPDENPEWTQPQQSALLNYGMLCAATFRLETAEEDLDAEKNDEMSDARKSDAAK
jgi:hypothetical protein